MRFLDIINEIKSRFNQLGFTLDKVKNLSEDLGMHKYAKFSCKDYGLDFYYDRGGIELVIIFDDQILRDVIGLANWLKNAEKKYQYPPLTKTNDEEKIKYLTIVLEEEFELVNNFLIHATDVHLSMYKDNQKFEGAKILNCKNI